ncbi:putative RNA-binding protein with RPS1 domain [Acetoanaerobium pronyense]|uniref:RNA-binding protein with RPS1 domain n=1 Tax=Acetoanaerobium pronyense TaxID=1482736 RepID=A0ABS4KGT0_9FIRM|nr:S1 RNA-binding domain-containing protein [Acetoanaerobium pronyense]MBP2026341.1 putative RNA-binding protein with RPS1 domain [Acetoanaerobium pronyense]
MSNILEVGMIVEGKVIQIKPFGAFISLGENKRGLVHISQISHDYIKEVGDALKEGDTVKVKILSIEAETGKISLSIKDANPKPKVEREQRPFKEKSFERPNSSDRDKSFKKEPEKSGTLEDMLKDWTKQSNDRQADINRRLKR